MSKLKTEQRGSDQHSTAELKQGYKVYCDACSLKTMDVDHVDHAGPTLASRVQPKKFRRSESKKGS